MEQLAFCTVHGRSGMFIYGDDGKLSPMTLEQARQSVQVFQGQLTCCRREHAGMDMCDQQKLVGPILGLYGAAYDKHVHASHGKQGTEFELIKETVFPRTFEFKQRNRAGKLTSQKRVLFGTLVRDMLAYVDEHGAGKGLSDKVLPSEIATPVVTLTPVQALCDD